MKAKSYVHDGGIDWKCSNGCRGTVVFQGMVTKTEHPLVSDYDARLVEVEVEHALGGCNGRLRSCGGYHHTAIGRQGFTYETGSTT